MTPEQMMFEQMQGEIEDLRQQQQDQRKHWLRCGYGSLALSLAFFVAIGIRVARTGDDPAPQMVFIQLIFLFAGLAFLPAGQPRMPLRWRRR
jgi:hypothetical protein